jgi:hypothetical protein
VHIWPKSVKKGRLIAVGRFRPQGIRRSHPASGIRRRGRAWLSR